MEWNQFELNGSQFAFAIVEDCDSGAIWEECEGHGPVRELRRDIWDRFPKAPGERLIYRERGHALAYDFAEACRMARRDGWGFLPGELKTEERSPGRWRASVRGVGQYVGQSFEATAPDINAAVRAVYDAFRATFPSPRAYAAAAAAADMRRCELWAAGDIGWRGVIVARVCPSCGDVDESGATQSLWGIESDSGAEYFEELARELAEELGAA